MLVKELESRIQEALREKYGTNPDHVITKRTEEEKEAIESSGSLAEFVSFINIINWVKENGSPYWVAGSVGSSFILYLLGITRGNPLPPHLYCPKCHKTYFGVLSGDGFDRFCITKQEIEKCDCGNELIGDGHNIPWQTLWRYGDRKMSFAVRIPVKLKERLNNEINDLCASESQVTMRAGLADNVEHFGNKEIDYMMNDIPEKINEHCPSETEIRDSVDHWRDILKIDYAEELEVPAPLNFEDLIYDYGLIHSTGPWNEKTKRLCEDFGYRSAAIPAFRDDVFEYYMRHHKDKETAWKIMESVRKGRGVPAGEHSPGEKNRPDQWVEYVFENMVRYLFPKAHAVEYVLYRMLLLGDSSVN